MKKILFTLAAAAMVLGAASCQKENLGKIETVKTVDNPLNTITVVCGADTRLAIDENLTPVFEENDVIFGWDKEGTTYAYTCTGVAEDVATFTRTSSGAPSADNGTRVNLVFAPGYGIEDIKDKTLDVNLAVQGETLPVVMHATGVVDEQGECNVTFSNDVAIVDIKDAVLPGAAEGDEYTVAFHGKNTSLKFSLNESGVINYQADVEGPISSSVKAVVGADSKISKKFAVPASLEATDVIITAMAADGSTYSFTAGSKEIVAGNYIKVSDKEFTLQYVAEVGGVGYPTLAKAVEAANAATDDVTIKMLEDVEVSSTIKTTNDGGHKITLDLAGHTIEATGSYAISNSTTELVITGDGKIQSAEDGKGVVRNYESGTLTIAGGEISGYGNDANGVVYSYGGGTLNIVGGKISTVSGVEGRAVNATATVNVSGGTISSDAGYALRVYGTATAIVGGENLVIYAKAQSPVTCATNSGNAPTMTFSKGYVYSDGDKAPFNKSAESTLTVSGGYYNNIVIGNMEEGKACMEIEPVQGPDGRSYGYEVKEGVVYVAKVVATDYEETFTDCTAALDAAMTKDESTVTILTDCGYTYDANKTIEAGKSLTLDLNGKKVTFSKYRIDVDGGTFTIKDSQTGGEYVNTANSGYYGVNVTSGEFNLESGTVEVQGSSAAVRAAGGTVNISGGVVKNTGSSYGIHLAGGTGNITGGVVFSKESHAVYMSTEASTLNIHGGVYIAANATDKDNVFPLYTNTKDKKHILNVDSQTSVPYFYGGGKNDASDVKYQDRLLYVAYTTTKSVTAGYTQKHYWVNKTNTSAKNGGVDNGYTVVELQAKQTFEFEGVTYEFGYQVQKDN